MLTQLFLVELEKMGKNVSRFVKKKIADLLPENTATRRITTAINIC